MKKRQKYIFILFLLLFASTIGFHQYIGNYVEQLDGYIEKLEEAIHPQEVLLEQALLNDQLFNRIIQFYDPNTKTIPIIESREINELALQNFTIIIYKDQDPIFWSNDNILPTSDELNKIFEPNHSKCIRLGNGYYEVQVKPIVDQYGNYQIVGLLPLKSDFPIQRGFLKNDFFYVQDFPRQIEILDTLILSNVVKSKDDLPLFSISKDNLNSIRDQRLQKWFLILLFFTGLPFCYLINELANHFASRYNFWSGFLFLGSLIGALKLSIAFTPLSVTFESIPYLEQIFSLKVLNGTLGSFVLTSFFIFWITLFFHQRYHPKIPYRYEPQKYLLWSTFIYAITLFSLLGLTLVIKKLVLESNLVFDFDNILQFNLYSTLAILSIILLIISLFLFALKLMSLTLENKQKPHHKLVAFGLGLLCNIPLIFYFDLHFPLYVVLLFTVLFVFNFELFLEYKFPGFTWLVVWTTVFSILGTVLILKYNLEKDLENRIRFAEQKIKVENQEDYNELGVLRRSLQSNSALINALYPKDSIRPNKKETFRLIDQLLHSEVQFYEKFSPRFFAYFSDQDSIPIEGQTEEERVLFMNVIEAYDTTSMEGVFYAQNNVGDYSYALQTQIVPPHDSFAVINGILVLTPITEQPSKVYSELLSFEPYNLVAASPGYEFTLFQNDEEVKRVGIIDDYILELAGSLKVNEHRNETIDGVATLIYKFDNSKIAIVRKRTGGFMRYFSLFSFLFVLNIFVILILSLLSRFFGTGASIGIAIIGQPSLKNRIQAAVVLLNIGSFLLIALVTAAFFRNSSIDYHYKRFQRKINAVVEDLQNDIDLLARGGTANIDYKGLLSAASQIHKMDINLYNLQGKLIKSSAGVMQDLNILPPIMDARAYFTLKKNQKSNIQSKKLGDLNYREAFIPIKLSEEEAISGYLSIPYYAKNKNLSQDIYDFMGTMLNVYVVLFLLAGVIAIFVANSITKPLGEIGEKIKGLRLGKNEPLKWNSKDELGKLITEYNKMIFKLEESTEKLKVTEREGAWREMAKQIAHEIKNPLTPMKLNIQYLMRAYKGNPADIEPKLNRISHTLIDQIDGLSRIASEFSNFAKMPNAENQAFNINHLLESIHNLFKENPQDIEISLSLPDEQFIVYADKGHLMRVFNNLVKNAIQAIPEERKGKILISLVGDLEEHIIIATVKDNGTGISKSMREKVFYPNFTTKNSGMGLGLAISKNIIETANGKIYFHTKDGIGTTFFVELPIYETEPV